MLTEVTKRTFMASVWEEDEWYVAQAIDVDVASQGKSVDDALANLREALELHFESPVATATPPDTPDRGRGCLRLGRCPTGWLSAS